MGTKKIDALQSAQIVALETDVAELRTKLNLLVTDVQSISVKLNILIGDLNDMNEVIMLGYTTPGSPASHGILESLDLYKDRFQDHYERRMVGYQFPPGTPISPHQSGEIREHLPTTYQDQGGQYSPPGPGYTPPPGGSWSPGSPVVGGTGQGGNTAHDPDAEDAGAMHTYGNVHRLLTVKGSSANRAKKLARQTLNRLRK